MHRPIWTEPLITDEDLFDDHITGSLSCTVREFNSGGWRGRQVAMACGLQVEKILHRIEQSVRMITAQTGHLTATQQPQNNPVHGLEDLEFFNTDRRQMVDIEKSPIVDLIRRHPPVAEAIRLMR